MKQYLLIRPDEDGNPLRWLTEDDVRDLLGDPLGTYSVKQFITPALRPEPDPNYWADGDAMLVEYTVVVPEPVTTAWKLPS